MKKCAIICNLHSGRGIKQETISKLIVILNNSGYEATTYITQKEQDAIHMVENLPHVDLVISMGGDGTFSEVITGNFKREAQLTLTHIPIGTANDIGAMFGLRKNNPVNNLNEILAGEIKNVDICFINGQPFAYVAGFGKYIQISCDTPKKYKKIFGYLAYAAQGVIEFFKPTKLYELEYTVNGETYKGLFSIILVSNANSIAGFNNIYKNIKLDDKKFEVMFCSINKRKNIIRSFYFLKTTDIHNVPGIYFHQTNKLEIKFKEKPKKYWTIDGEKFKPNSKIITFDTKYSIKMLVPTKNIKNLFK